MMNNGLDTIAKSAKDLSRNPLGIIALFIVLVYGFACLLFGFSAATLAGSERLPLIWFVIIFPALVLFMFGWLVSNHHDKLYSPSDYRNDESFLKTTVQQQFLYKLENTEVSEKQIDVLMEYGKEFELIADNENRIKKDLESKNLDYTNGTSKVLIHHLAVAQFIGWFEKIYSTLFGSQILLLTKLHALKEGMNKDDLLSHFNITKERNPNAFLEWALSNYLEYLYGSALLEKKGERVFITKNGSEFLSMLDKSGYTKQKAL